MPCDFPLAGYRSRHVNPSGKRSYVFKRSESLTGVREDVKCGQCTGCRLEYSRQWGMRCENESRMHPENCFLTLTYEDDKLPAHGSLKKEDLQLFHKRLHNRLLRSRGFGIRYFGAGEYGEENGRPHYHSLVFGYDLPDRKFWKTTKAGYNLYTSRLLDSVWGHGYGVVGDVSFDSACYVARYVMKKVNGVNAGAHYCRDLPDYSGYVQLVPEFSHMSRGKGIGHGFYMKYAHDIYAHDHVIFNSKPVQPPRYYDTLYRMVDSMFMDELKEKRRLDARSHGAEFKDVDRRRARRLVGEAKVNLKRRAV